MAEEDDRLKIPEQLKAVEEVGAPRLSNFKDKMSESALEASRNIPQLPVAPNGIFRHPSTWTDEENEIIARGIKAHLPLQVIGTKVNCERGTLSKHIKNTPELLQLFEDAKEDLVDRGEFEADRLMRAGNPAMVMFVLERMGRKRGWGQQEYVAPKNEDDVIQFTAIPDSEIDRAKAIMEEKGAVADDQIAIGEIDPKDMPQEGEKSEVFVSDPIKQAQMQEAAAQEETEHPQPMEIRGATVSPAPYEDEQLTNGGAPWPDDGGGDFNGGDADDPFPEAEFSPFGSI